MRKPMHNLAIAVITALVIAVSCPAFSQSSSTQRPDYGSLEPVMGWSSWSYLRAHPSASAVEAQAKALVTSGLASHGYVYVNIDDFWYGCPKDGEGPEVNQYGLWVTDRQEFPNGIAAVADYVHKLGLKFGIYITPGISKRAVEKNTVVEGTNYHARDFADIYQQQINYNCGGMVSLNFNKPGAQAFIDSEVNRFAKWGVDFIKLDGNNQRSEGGSNVAAWSQAIRNSGRKMVFDATEIPISMVPVASKYSNQWESASDVECYACELKQAGRFASSSFPLTSWTDVSKRFRYAAELAWSDSPGGHMDLDSVDIGNGDADGIDENMRKTVLSLWSLASSPLILGSDLTQLDSYDLGLLENKAIIQLDQNGRAAKRVVYLPGLQVFTKSLPDGRTAVGVFNTSDQKEPFSIPVAVLGLQQCNPQGCSAEDLWNHGTTQVKDTVSGSLPGGGVLLLSVTK